MPEIQFFDRDADFAITWRRLPHWSQPGTLTFITFRTRDSMPRPVVNAWVRERNRILDQHGIDPGGDWRASLNDLPKAAQMELRFLLTVRWDSHLDCSHGACVLRDSKLAKIVGDSLRMFDGDRYELTDFVVMPNHVHVLAAFESEEAMLSQVAGWKRFTATQINKALARRGHFWQEDQFDHLVRNGNQFESLRKYIADNGPKLGLPPDQHLHWSKEM
jgi:putative transposase